MGAVLPTLHDGSRGTTLIEVLVALAVLAVGLLGMAGLQTQALRISHDAYLRTQATMLAVDGAEWLKASADDAGLPDALAGWQESVAALPSGDGRVCLDSTPNDGTPGAPACDGLGSLHAVKVWWDGDRDGRAEQRLAMGFRR